MNDAELRALAVLVSRETFLMQSENIKRQEDGKALAYDEETGYTPNCKVLEAELIRRGVIK